MSVRHAISEEVQNGHYMANVVNKLIKNAVEDLKPIALAAFKEEVVKELKKLKII